MWQQHDFICKEPKDVPFIHFYKLSCDDKKMFILLTGKCLAHVLLNIIIHLEDCLLPESQYAFRMVCATRDMIFDMICSPDTR